MSPNCLQLLFHFSIQFHTEREQLNEAVHQMIKEAKLEQLSNQKYDTINKLTIVSSKNLRRRPSRRGAQRIPLVSLVSEQVYLFNVKSVSEMLKTSKTRCLKRRKAWDTEALTNTCCLPAQQTDRLICFLNFSFILPKGRHQKVRAIASESEAFDCPGEAKSARRAIGKRTKSNWRALLIESGRNAVPA